MLSWNEYIEELLSNPTVLDKMSLQYRDNVINVSPIVKASIQMLECMIETEGRHNAFVFPEIKETLFEFVLSKIVFNVAAGKINIRYNPHSFEAGQKLKFKNCVVEFDKCVEKDFDGKGRIYIRCADKQTFGLPIEMAPVFQIADSNAKRFSKLKVFREAYYNEQATVAELQSNPEKRDIIEELMDYKTHLDGSIFLVTNARNAKEYFDETRINGSSLKDVLLIGKIQSDGSIDSCYSGQLSGNPAIVLAPDLYSVLNAIEHGAKVQSIIINLSQGALLENQLDVLDDLSNGDFPILCLTDTSSSFEMDGLLERGYNLWRWNSNSLIEVLHTSNQKTAGKRFRNCAIQKVNCENISCLEVGEALQLLYNHKAELEEQGTDVIATYNKLFSILFTALRIAVPFQREELSNIQQILKECKESLECSKRFMEQNIYGDLKKVVLCFEKIFVNSFENPKISKIIEILSSKKYSSICIVIADRFDKMRCEKYWRDYTVRKRIPTIIKVLYPQEYVNFEAVNYDATIIVGWLNNRNMRNVIYCYGTQEYIVLTYECEDKWRKAHTKIWSRSLSNSSNNKIVKNSFSRKARTAIADDKFTEGVSLSQEETFDELTDIENVIQLNTYRRYGVSANGENQIVEAYPVNFVGGYLAFYRTGHKIITVTDIIIEGKDNVTLKTPDLLRHGDFVAVRETQRDIIRDIADKILENSGKPHAREIALRWRDALNVETMFSTLDEIYHNLQKHGCTRGFQTVKNWIEDENQFSLSSKEDLICIAKALNDEMLLETIDDVYMAGVDVKRAHLKAGQYLSQRLRHQIADRITEFGEIDVFNIWEPIELQLEDIGKVIILKIIDINRPIQIDSSNTNRLLSE